MREDERDRVSRLGSEAWKRLKKCKDYNDWLKVGEALLVGREWAMDQAQTNKPEGKGYVINVASYKNGVGYGKWMHIDGWSESVIEYIRALEGTS